MHMTRDDPLDVRIAAQQGGEPPRRLAFEQDAVEVFDAEPERRMVERNDDRAIARLLELRLEPREALVAERAGACAVDHRVERDDSQCTDIDAELEIATRVVQIRWSVNSARSASRASWLPSIR